MVESTPLSSLVPVDFLQWLVIILLFVDSRDPSRSGSQAAAIHNVRFVFVQPDRLPTLASVWPLLRIVEHIFCSFFICTLSPYIIHFASSVMNHSITDSQAEIHSNQLFCVSQSVSQSVGTQTWSSFVVDLYCHIYMAILDLLTCRYFRNNWLAILRGTLHTFRRFVSSTAPRSQAAHFFRPETHSGYYPTQTIISSCKHFTRWIKVCWQIYRCRKRHRLTLPDIYYSKAI